MRHTRDSGGVAGADRAWPAQEIICKAGRGVELCAVIEDARARDALGTIILVHGSGTTRHDAPNRFIARVLADAGFHVMRLDLLAESEAHDRHNVFDADLQAERLLDVTAWLGSRPLMRASPVGYLGTGIGAIVVLETAARAPASVSAIVVQGPTDAARFWLPRVAAPTLVIADANPRGGLSISEGAYHGLSSAKELVRVATPGHCFTEPEAIVQVARHAQQWFVRHFARDATPARGDEPAPPAVPCQAP